MRWTSVFRSNFGDNSRAAFLLPAAALRPPHRAKPSSALRASSDGASPPPQLCDLGLVPYADALALQHALHAQRVAGAIPDTLLSVWNTRP
jgi:hypothetical protein